MESELIKRIESQISATPTGDLRNLLCDVNITIQVLTLSVKNTVNALDDLKDAVKILEDLKLVVNEL